MLALAELVFVGDGIHDAIHLVDVGADASRFLLDAGIDFRDHKNPRVDDSRVVANLFDEIRHGLNAKIDPLAEICVLKVAQLEVSFSHPGRSFREKPQL